MPSTRPRRRNSGPCCDEVERAHAKGQPVLVGTITIEVSEHLSSMLKKRGIRHNVLNATVPPLSLRPRIVAQAGQHGAVTIATNMAGRGTDIKLDDEARAAGGLKIIGTERHESRRIDNQLRGRSGRQGDPGESRFYISLEDDLMRLFGSERLMNVFNALGVEDGEQIEHKMLSSAIEKAQEKDREQQLRHPQEPAGVRPGHERAEGDHLRGAPQGAGRREHAGFHLPHDQRVRGEPGGIWRSPRIRIRRTGT